MNRRGHLAFGSAVAISIGSLIYPMVGVETAVLVAGGTVATTNLPDMLELRYRTSKGSFDLFNLRKSLKWMVKWLAVLVIGAGIGIGLYATLGGKMAFLGGAAAVAVVSLLNVLFMGSDYKFGTATVIKHRTWTHWIAPWLVLLLAGLFFFDSLGGVLAVAIACGAFSHILADSLTPMGVPVLTPYQRFSFKLVSGKLSSFFVIGGALLFSMALFVGTGALENLNHVR